MTRRLAALLAVTALAIAACGEPADTGSTTEPGGTVPPTTDGSTAPTNSPSTPDPADFANTNWAVVSFGLDGADDAVLPDNILTIRFGPDGIQVGGTSGCNSYGGLAVYSPETGITLADLSWTEMACLGDDVMDQEQRFFQALSRVDGFFLSAGSLVLDASDGSAVIRSEALASGPMLPLAGSWRLTTFVDEDVAMSVLAGTEITLTLDPDEGTLSGNAGCNGFSGGVTVDTGAGEVPATIVVGPLASTLMACEPDVMDQESMFHSILGEATEMQTDTAFLTVSTEDGRALIFEPAGE